MAGVASDSGLCAVPLHHFYRHDPRAFEAVFANPTAHNIDVAVTRLERADNQALNAFLDVLQDLISKDFLDKEDPVYTAMMEAVVGAVRRNSSDVDQVGTGSPRKAEISKGDTPADGFAVTMTEDQDWKDD